MPGSSLGKATMDPHDDVVAGQVGTWRFTFRVGEMGLAEGGRIRVYTDTDTDWGSPQFINPAAEDYATLVAPGRASLRALIEGQRSLLIVNDGRALHPAEEIVLTLGDRSLGSNGSRAQTFQEASRYFRVEVDWTGSGEFEELPDPPSLRIVGGDPVRLVIVAPSQVEVGECFNVLLRLEDAWGNPATVQGCTVDFLSNGVQLPTESHELKHADGGVARLSCCRCAIEGVHTIRATLDSNHLSATSNPILCVEARGKYSLYWGDPHGGQLVSAEKVPQFFRFARDIARLDFVGYQRNDHQLSNQDWETQQKSESEFYIPSRFVPIPGYEWSGSLKAGGHHNIYFRRYGQPIHRCKRGSSGDEVGRVLPHIRDVYDFYRGSDVILTPHVGGNHADLSFHEPSLESAIEVVSTHGTFEWFREEALKREYRVGFIGGSDGYTGRPGAEYPGRHDRRYAKGGLTALYAEELTLEGVFDALKARRCYATTGARILVDVKVDGHLMGDEYTTTVPPTLSFRVHGTTPIESVELFRGLNRIAVFPKDLCRNDHRIRITWEGASGKSSYSGVVWDGVLQVRGTNIREVQTLRFDSPRSFMHLEGHQRLLWNSVSCGYRTGIEVELEMVTDNVELQLGVHTELITRPGFGHPGALTPVSTPLRRTSFAPAERVLATLRLSELSDGQRVIELGALERRIVVSRALTSDSSCSVEHELQDTTVEPGLNPYWLRVTQQDLEMAWTSPVFVDFIPKTVD